MLKNIYIILLASFGLFSMYFIADKFTFLHYGSIRPIINASSKFNSLDELSSWCKKDDKSLVLRISTYKDGRSYARCEDQFFAQTWDVSKLLNTIK